MLSEYCPTCLDNLDRYQTYIKTRNKLRYEVKKQKKVIQILQK